MPYYITVAYLNTKVQHNMKKNNWILIDLDTVVILNNMVCLELQKLL